MKISKRYNGRKSEIEYTYLIEFRAHMSSLAIFKGWNGTVDCGFVNSTRENSGYRKVGFLELLLDLGISQRKIEKIVHDLQATKTSIASTDIMRFIRGETDELKEYNNGKPWVPLAEYEYERECP